jgi:hypothetical protein
MATMAQRQTGSTFESRREKQAKLMRKEAALARALETETGLRKIAANMANPVRQRLDYKGIWRKFAIVEQMPDGVPLIFDRDLPEVPAVKIGHFGTVRMIEMFGTRTEPSRSRSWLAPRSRTRSSTTAASAHSTVPKIV